jgi:hypothetical protein
MFNNTDLLPVTFVPFLLHQNRLNQGVLWRFSMVEKESSAQENARLAAQVDELNKKLDALNTKLDKTQANSDALMAQSQQTLAAANAAKSQEIMRQTVANPTGFIAKEVVQFVIKSLEKNQKSKTKQWMVTRGRGVVEAGVGAFIAQKLPQLNWYNSSVTGTQTADNYHMVTRTSFPVEINTGVPFVGRVALTRIIVEVESDVNPKTNETSNVKCHMSNEQVNKDLLTSLQEDTTNYLKPHKTIWSIVRPIGLAIRGLYRFMLKETNFSIPWLILFILTTFFYNGIPPAPQIWGILRWPTATIRIFGISPLSVLWGIVNGIIWGAAIWAIIRFNIIPGLGKVFKFIRMKIFPALKDFFEHPYYRWGTIGLVVVIVVVIVLWRVGVFEGPPPLQFANANIPNSRVGTEYSAQFSVLGGKTPYSWKIVGSTLPAGLTLDPATGKLIGNPTTPGSYPIVVDVTDNNKDNNTTTYNLRVAAADSLIITETNLPSVRKMDKYNAQVAVLGGVGPYRWGFLSGTLPPGLTFDATGKISGIPTNEGTYTFAVTVADSSNPNKTFDQTFTIIIKP